MVDDNRLVCGRCGWSWVVDQLKRSSGRVLCVSCRMRPALSIQYGASRCIPWKGDFDREDSPIHHGVPILPGKRLCGHSDCVNANHIELDDVVDTE